MTVTGRTSWQLQIPIIQLPDFQRIVPFAIPLMQTSGQVPDSITVSSPWYRVIQVLFAPHAIHPEPTPMPVQNAAPVISRITCQQQIPAIQPLDSPRHVFYAIPLNLGGNLHHLQSMIPNHSRFIPGNTRVRGLHAPNAILILPATLSSHASHAMSITRPPWMKSTGKRVVIHIQARHAFSVIPEESQMIKNNL